MLTTSVILFAIAAAFGLILIASILKNKSPNRGAVAGHGLFAASGLLLVILYTFNNPSSPVIALILFIIAALGGFVLLARDLSGKPGPKGLAVIHASAAVIGFLLLLIFVLGMT